MTSIVFLEIISTVSLIYSLLLVFFPFAPVNQVFIVFIWTVLGSITFGMNYNKSKIYQASIFFLLLPLIFYNSSIAIYFIAISMVLIYLFVTKSFMKGNYYEFIERLKKTYFLYALLAIMAVLNEGFHKFMSHSIPFIIIYLLSTIILVRSLRHMETGMDINKLKELNRKYISIISGVSLIVTLDILRNFIFGIIKGVYKFIMNILLMIAYYPITLIYNIMNKIIGYLMNKANEYGALKELLGLLSTEEFQAQDPDAPFVYSRVLSGIMEVVLIIIIILVIYKLITKAGDRKSQGVDYIEEREFIREPKNKKRRFFREKYPRDLKEQIRYYYRRYLEKLRKKEVEIYKYNTSLDINKRAVEVYDGEIEKIRQIYIDVRYGDKEVGESSVKEIEKLYKDL